MLSIYRGFSSTMTTAITISLAFYTMDCIYFIICTFAAVPGLVLLWARFERWSVEQPQEGTHAVI